MTIKQRIVIWYTIWMAVLVVIAFVVLLSAGGAMIRHETISELEEAVYDASEDIWTRDGRIIVDDDIDYIDDGIYLSIWQGNTLVRGRYPSEMPEEIFSGDSIREVDWLEGTWFILDFSIDEDYFIRGTVRAYDAALFSSSIGAFMLIALPLMVILAALGGYYIVRRSLKPAETIVATAEQIAGSDNLSKRIALGDGDDEIHQMASAFDRMLDRIENAFVKEQQFTSDASHELRTPISVILAEADYASSHTAEEEKVSEALCVISRQAGKMSRLVSELLSLARSDKGTLTPEFEDFNLSELGEMVLQTFEEKAAGKDIKLYLKAEPGVIVQADQGMITRIMINLIANAVNYGRDGGMVVLRISCNGENAEFAVEDNGIGISASDIGRIWDRFYQVDSSRTGDEAGAGLGLPIAKELVALHKGRIKVDSIEGEGSVFTVEIPLRQE